MFRANGELPGEVHARVLGPADAPRAVFVHGSMSWGDDPVSGFAAQEALAERFRLVLMDRRGHGGSPDAGPAFRSDYLADADDIAELLDGGAHLVGHSYGAVGAMMAAARRPEDVLSLTLIEPGCYQAAADDPQVAAALQANREAYADFPELTPAQWLRAATDSVGMPPMEPTEQRLRAAGSALNERVCWEAGIPVPALRIASFPKLIVSGTWETAPDLYRERGAGPLLACARVTAERIGARHVSVPGSAHYPHVDAPQHLNDILAAFWEASAIASRA
ncbi:alpha/beta fold hydrolase [Actinomadura rupiterrae]|uniref:alpha/beta fold hydrolase n=1 Tax=Actinomadura rupiterrae TaxID=559627 RepID=UPI0020A43E70|nr:alpha/beta hydrolase [Actinomadura rupiterrae]MCP2340433.1 pimeloyl-ACP methyl ester carboxylesterase [Actinomadura rupiterrae]